MRHPTAAKLDFSAQPFHFSISHLLTEEKEEKLSELLLDIVGMT